MKKLAVIKQPDFNVVDLKGQAITTSRNIAEVFSKEHKHVMEAIRNCEASEEFSQSNFRQSNYTDSRGKIQPEYLITKDGFSMLAFGFTGKEAARFKEAYIKKFNYMESILREKQTPEWQQSRKAGIHQQHALFDTIQLFTQYAKSQGSQNYNKYYQHFNNLLNSVVDIQKGQRDLATIQALSAQTFIMNMVNTMILVQMEDNTPYKEVYRVCKDKVVEVMALVRPVKQIAN